MGLSVLFNVCKHSQIICLKDARSLNFSPHQNSVGATQDMDWIFDGAEYDPMWPNDYEKVVKGKLLCHDQ